MFKFHGISGPSGLDLKGRPLTLLIISLLFALSSLQLAWSQQLDETWTLTVGGQTVSVNSDGSFRVPNITALDQWGAGGPGTPLDFISDKFFRITGISTAGGQARYVFSQPFRVSINLADPRSRVVIRMDQLTFTTIPPPLPESIRIELEEGNVLEEIGGTLQLTTVATLGDGTEIDVSSESLHTSYITSNPAVAMVNSNGLVTATGAGRAQITAVNEAVTAVQTVVVNPTSLTTTVSGRVVDELGNPASQVTVILPILQDVDRAGSTTADESGNFSFSRVPTTLGNISLFAYSRDGSTVMRTRIVSVEPAPGSAADAGLLELSPYFPTRRAASAEKLMLAIDGKGNLFGWGRNITGEVGDGTLTPRYRPVKIMNGGQWLKVVTALRGPEFSNAPFSMGIQEDGSLWRWGSNFDSFGPFKGNALSGGINSFLSEPVEVLPGNQWLDIDASNQHALAVRGDGTLWGIGSNGSGQLGLGDFDDRPNFVQIGSDSDWRQVSAEGGFSLAIKANGSLWAWGANTYGQLGTGDTLDRNEPTQVGSDTWLKVDGWGGISSYTVAVRNDLTLWAWGTGGGSSGGFSTITAPRQVGADNDWIDVAAGVVHALALKLDTTLWAWGRTGQTGGIIAPGASVEVTEPIAVTSSVGWTGISAASLHSLAVRADGKSLTWGKGLYLGVEGLDILLTYGFQDVVLPHALSVSGEVLDSNANPVENAIVRTSNGVSTLSGSDGSFQLDNVYAYAGDLVMATYYETNSRSLLAGDAMINPTDGTSDLDVGPITLDDVGSRTTHHSIACGSFGEWVLALKNDRSLWGWGQSIPGIPDDLVNQTELYHQDTPAQIGADTDWTAISGRGFMLGLKQDGSLWSWGLYHGYLGRTGEPNIPAKVGMDNDWALISAGDSASAAIKSDGSLWTWGSLGDGLLGRDGQGDVPGQVGTDTDWALVSPGRDHMIAIKQNGTLWAWGSNLNYQLGDATTEASSEPVMIGADTDWWYAYGTKESSLAVKRDGSLWMWGREVGNPGDGGVGFSKTPAMVNRDAIWISLGGESGVFSSLHGIDHQGRVWVWGWSPNPDFPYIGAGDRFPAQAAEGADWFTICAQQNYVIGLRSSGELWGWGKADNGVLGRAGQSRPTGNRSPGPVDGGAVWSLP